MKRYWGLPCMFLLIACSASTQSKADGALNGPHSGEDLFEQYCSLCHGDAGDLQLSGATDLTRSALERGEILAVIKYGRGAMMPYQKLMDKDELQRVTEHVLSLRN